MRLFKFVLALFAAFVSFFIMSADADAASIKCTFYYTEEYTAVKLTPINSGDRIFYTIDGTVPTSDSKEYTKKLGFYTPAEVMLAEYDKNGVLVGKVKTITVERIVPKPDILVKDRLDGTADVQIICPLEGAEIHFTKDGTEPDESSAVLKKGLLLHVKKDCEIKAVAVKQGWKTSACVSEKPLELVTRKSYEEYISQAFDITNQIRKEHGLSPLKLNSKLSFAAYVRAKELSQNYENGHTRPNGLRWTTAIKEAGYIHYFAGENYGKLYKSGVDPQKIMDMWMISTIHSDNILNTIGPDVGFGFYQKDGYCYWIQLFGKLK
ncbi:MAG: chitobiase/beta-hexosaminidase C-terminal domain-containing protein [Ruminiclostridium sp.]|nr:chitobiase/beta-hexosaminidase C-terminal domain-containing protein [Ruminiclostridium sp.]